MFMCFEDVGKRLLQDKPFWVVAYKRRCYGQLQYGSVVCTLEKEAMKIMKESKAGMKNVSYLHIRLYSVHDEVYELVEDWRK